MASREKKRGRMKKIREYVDINQDNMADVERLEDLVVNLVLKLK